MIALAWQNLHGRRRIFLGTFVALAFGVALVTTLGLVLAAASGGTHDGPGRFADAPLIVRTDPDLSAPDSWGSESVAALAEPAPLPSALVARLDDALGAGNVVADRTFAAQTPDGPSGQVGHGWSAAAFGGYRLLPGGSAPTGTDEVVLPAAEGIAVGTRVEVVTATGPAGYLVSGLTAPVFFESAVFFSDAEAARLSPPVDDVVVVYGSQSPQNASAVADTVRRIVGGGGAEQVLAGAAREAANPQAQQDSAELVGVSTLLGLAAGVGGFVAVLVIGSTFAFSVNQRRRELALLRMAGATPGDMRALLRGEALLVGAGSGVAGCGLGLVFAPALARWMVGHALAPASFHIGAGLADLLVLPAAFGIGLVLAVLGVGLAAFRAGRIAPVEALRESRSEPRRRGGGMRWMVLGAMLALAVGACIVGSALILPPSYWAQLAPGLAVAFVSCGLLTLPMLAPRLARTAIAPLARSRGAGAQLVRSSLDTTYRTAATAAPIFVTIGLFCCLWTADTGVRLGAQREAYAQAAASEYVVLPQYGASLGAGAVAQVEAVPGVRAAVLTPTTVYSVPGHNMLIYPSGAPLLPFPAVTVNPAALADGALQLPIVSGSVSDLDDSSIIVDQSWNHGVGDEVTVWLADGARRSFRVAAVMKASIGGAQAVLSDAYSGTALPTMMFVGQAGGVPAGGGAGGSGMGAALAGAVRGQAARVVPTAQWTAYVSDTQATQLREALYVVGGISLLYTGIAVANTLAMSTRRRGRELAVLRLAGATPGQVVRMVAAEGAVVAVVGALLAAAAVGLTALAVRIALAHLVGTLPMALPAAPFLLIAGTCALVALAATLLPARRVLRRSAIRSAAAQD